MQKTMLKLAVFAMLVSVVCGAVLQTSVGQARSTSVFGEQATKPVIDVEMIRDLNIAQSQWTAGANKRFAGMTQEEFRGLLGVPLGSNGRPHRSHRLPVRAVESNVDVPASFNSKDNWPQCVTMNMILDQGHCGSCWAFGAVEAMSDRICVSHGQNILLAAEDLVACCDSCGDGCNGGYPEAAWEYFQSTGVVDAMCAPYFDQKGCQHPGCTPEYPTPACVKKCNNTASWSSSKHFGVSAYSVPSEVSAIQQEIFSHGPVEAAFTVYEDFAHYTSGVYHYTHGSALGGHAIEIVGWGTTGGEDYWIVKNSWNTSWGMDGYFWIRRGTDECGIESGVVAGLVR